MEIKAIFTEAAPCAVVLVAVVAATTMVAVVAATLVIEPCILTMLSRWTRSTMTVVMAMEVPVAASVVAVDVVMGGRTVRRLTHTNNKIETGKRVNNGEEDEVTLIFFSLLILTLQMIRSFMDMYPT